MKMCKDCMVYSGALLHNNTMMKDYYEQACREDNTNYVLGGNLSIISNVLYKRKSDPSFRAPMEDELVVHLRLGDVIELADADVETMLIKGASPWHHASFKNGIKSAHEYIADIVKSGYKKVVIRGGAHWPQYYRKSRIYAVCLKEAITEAGYYHGFNVSMSLEGNSPDQDFYYLCHAKQIIVGVGGFSRLIGQIVSHYGGTIVGRAL